MLRSVLWTLRQRRYALIAALMFVVAIGCVGAGTWQIQRFNESVRDNNALTHNAHAAVVGLGDARVPLVGAGPAPGRDAIRNRTVTVTGTYVDGTQYAAKILNNTGGFYAVSALRSASGTILVARGWIAATSHGDPKIAPAPPSGVVTVSGRLQTPSSSINPTKQSAVLGGPVYNAYLTSLPKQPGGAGLVALPKPDLSNPAGGAYEGQHFAYIIQWYLFAVLALLSPFALARNEARDAQRRFLGLDPGEEELSIEARPNAAARLAGSGAEVAVRANGALATTDGPVSPEFARAQHLADRYGRSLSYDGTLPPDRGAAISTTGRAPTQAVPSSSVQPHRSFDDYHGSYNDYLWELGMADGKTPDVSVSKPEAEPTPAIAEPVVIDVDPDGDR